MPQTYAFAPSRYTSICSFVKAWDAKEVGLCAAHGENHRSSFIGSECNHFELSSLVRFTRRGGGRPQLTSRIWAPPSPRREDGGARGEGGAYPPPPDPRRPDAPPSPPPPRLPGDRRGELEKEARVPCRGAYSGQSDGPVRSVSNAAVGSVPFGSSHVI